MKRGLNLASLADANDDNNSTLAEGHFISQVLNKLGFLTALKVEHPEQGAEKFIYEFNDFEQAEKTMADPNTQKGEQQRSELSVAFDPTVPSLSNQNVPLDIALFQSVDVRINTDDTPSSHVVGPLIRAYRTSIAAGKPVLALSDLATGPVAAFQAKYPQKTVGGVVSDFVDALPGVSQIVGHSLPTLP